MDSIRLSDPAQALRRLVLEWGSIGAGSNCYLEYTWRSIDTVIDPYQEIRNLHVPLISFQEHARQTPAKSNRLLGEPCFSQLGVAQHLLSCHQNLFAASHEAAVL